MFYQKKLLFAFIFTLAAFFFSVSHIYAADIYFDSVAGSDAGDGSIGAPWQTIVKLQEQIQWAQPGDTIHLKAGSSWNINDLDNSSPAGLTITFATNGLAFYSSGTSGDPIILTVYGTGTMPTFTNPARSGFQSDQVFLVQGSNWVIDSVKITSGTIPASGINGDVAEAKKGIFVYQGSNNVIRNNEITMVGEGISIEASNNFIFLNNIHDLQMVVDSDNDSNDDSGAVGIVLTGSHNEVSYNTLQNCVGHSYDFGPTFQDGGAMEIFGKAGSSVDNNYIHHNYATGNEGFMELGGQDPTSASDNTISYNVLENNTRIFYFNLSGSFPISVDNLNFYNNTVVEKTTSLYGYLFAYSEQPTTASMLVVKNNIFYFDNSLTVSQTLDQANTLVHTNNVYFEYNIGGPTDAASLGFTPESSEILENPVFTSSSDYTLQETSPAVNAAVTLGTVTRYDGSTVSIQSVDLNDTFIPQSTAADIGAYESLFDTPSPSPSPSPSASPSPSPSPSADPTPTPDPTPEPTPTATPSSGSSSSGGNYSAPAPANPPGCDQIISEHAPEIFQIDVKGTMVTLYINPASEPYTSYFVSYALSSSAEQFGTEFAQSYSSGAIVYRIYDLQPNVTYYFKVRAGNGCRSGNWSNTIKIKTLKANQSTKTRTYYRANFFSDIWSSYLWSDKKKK